MGFLGILCLVLVTMTSAGIACRRVGTPAVIGQLLVEIVLGPAMLNIVHQDVFVHDFSEIDVIMLMLTVGMECELELLKKYVKLSVVITILGIVLSVGFTTLIGQLFTFSWREAFFLGLVLAATSISIPIEVLRELNVLSSKEGATIPGAFVVDDIAVVIILSVAVGMIGASTGGNTEVSFTVRLIEQSLFFIGIFFLVRSIAPYLLRLSQKMNIGSSIIIMSLIICLGMAYLVDLVGLSSVVGASFAGIVVEQTDAKTEIDFNIEATGYAVSIPVFFANIDLSVTFNTPGKDLPFILITTIMVILTKLLGGAWGAKMVGFSNTSSLTVGIGMVSHGEMALVIAQIGHQSKLLSEAYYTSMIVVVILAILVVPFLLKYFVKKQESALQ